MLGCALAAGARRSRMPMRWSTPERGTATPALPTSGALYEAVGAPGVVNDNTEQTILDRRPEDREIQPKKVRAAAERQANRVAE